MDIEKLRHKIRNFRIFPKKLPKRPGEPEEDLEHCQGAEAPCDSVDAKWYHNNTAYVDQELNWSYLCPFCIKQSDKYWKEMWDMYYSQIL